MLDDNLQRLARALSEEYSALRPPVPAQRTVVSPVYVASSLALGAAAAACWWVHLPVPVAAGVSAVFALWTATPIALRILFPASDPSRPNIGLGADVAADAVIEPGAVVGAGATVGNGARVKRGAVVRSGATVGARAVIEDRAVVSFGVTIQADATVGEGATIGAGSTVGSQARVPAGMRLLPGTDWRLREQASTPAVRDPRADRIDALCARLETELAASPESVRAFIGTSAEGVRALRQACHDLLAREQSVRAEAAPEVLAVLDRERAELSKKVEASADPATRRSLAGAVEAIQAQRAQRESMGHQAERLDAELTRLLWTLDGMNAQLARARAAEADLAAPDGEVARSVQQLNAEIEAIAGALQGLADEERAAFAEGAPAPISSGSSDTRASVPTPVRSQRSR